MKSIDELLSNFMPYKVAVSVAVFAIERDLQDDDIQDIINSWESYIAPSLNLGYSLDMICDTVLYNAVYNHEDYGKLADRAESVFCKSI